MYLLLTLLSNMAVTSGDNSNATGKQYKGWKFKSCLCLLYIDRLSNCPLYVRANSHMHDCPSSPDPCWPEQLYLVHMLWCLLRPLNLTRVWPGFKFQVRTWSTALSTTPFLPGRGQASAWRPWEKRAYLVQFVTPNFHWIRVCCVMSPPRQRSSL